MIDVTELKTYKYFTEEGKIIVQGMAHLIDNIADKITEEELISLYIHLKENEMTVKDLFKLKVAEINNRN